MNKILILGSEGFLGKKIYQFLKVEHNIYTLDLLSSERKNHIKKNIKVFKLAKFIKEKKINFIIDLIGSTNHNFLKKSDLKESYDKNYQHKINIINNLEKIKNEINYFSIGSIYKFGWRRKIKKKIFLPVNKSDDPQLIFKHKF
jgi:nucleoside-diphosphate-sugar epimerase